VANICFMIYLFLYFLMIPNMPFYWTIISIEIHITILQQVLGANCEVYE